jgi:hypothetical protein
MTFLFIQIGSELFIKWNLRFGKLTRKDPPINIAFAFILLPGLSTKSRINFQEIT